MSMVRLSYMQFRKGTKQKCRMLYLGEPEVLTAFLVPVYVLLSSSNVSN